MKIHGMVTSVPDPYSAAVNLDKGNEARRKNKTDSGEAQLLPSDSVTVSRDAQLLTEARRAAQNTPAVRAEKVEELRAQVANGTYKPDSKRIAASLAREEQELFNLDPLSRP